MRHTILAEDRNNAGNFARVCRRPDGAYSVELASYDPQGRLIVQSIICDGWNLALLRDALERSLEPEIDLILREGAEREREWLKTTPEEEARAWGIVK